MMIATSWDDGLESDKDLLTFLRSYGIRASFGLTPGRYMNKPVPNDARDARDGNKYGMLIAYHDMRQYVDHDVCNHTFYHTEMSTDVAAYQSDILAGKKGLEEYFEREIPGMIWPYGVSTREHREYAKSIGHTFGRTTPAPYRNWLRDNREVWDIVPYHWDMPVADILALPHTHVALYGHTYEFRSAADLDRAKMMYLELQAARECQLVTLNELAKDIVKHEPAGRLQL